MISGLLVGLGLLLAAASTVAVGVAAAAAPATPATATTDQQQQANTRLPARGLKEPGRSASSELMLLVNSSLPAISFEPEDDRKKAEQQELSSKLHFDAASNWAQNGERQPVYTNQFVIQVQGGELEARKLAEKHGFVFLNHILGDYYHLEHKRLLKRSTRLIGEDEEALRIQDEPQVLKIERQLLKRRVKRDFLELSSQPATPNYAGMGPSSSLPSQGGSAQTYRPNQPRPPLNRPAPGGYSGRPTSNSAGHQYTRPANQPARGRPRPLTQLPPVHEDLAGPEPLESAVAGQQQTHAGNTSLPFVIGLHSPKAELAGLGTPSAAAAAINASHPGIGSGNSSLSQRVRRPFNDPSWPLMWYLDGGAKNGFDLNVKAAWKMGYTGKGIVITILDDGLERNHPDLQANYDPLASFDINGDDADPMPRYDDLETNRHGTRCAGEVAAVPDNNICSIGIAYNSKVGGVRMLDGDVTDAVEARSLGLNNQHIHIYSASWGPDDNGRTVDGPGELATRAFIEGVTNGRQGLGSIFVFASGNGGRERDNCNCDGYTNSIWTLSISSATENGFVPWYIEACSSTLATTYSSGSYDERQISTTDIRGTCTSGHTGTSASAPLAAGICALVLESNPRLSWRDMQHIVVRTAKPANLLAKDWRQNALGRNVSHAFGYGLMDAASMIMMARRWTSVPVQYTCEVRSPQMEKFIPAKGHIELKLRAECANVRYLEHVQSKVTLSSNRRGDMHIYLISPHGTRSTLLAQRPHDVADQGFRNWPFMTVHSWGESPNGVWTLEVHNDGKPQNRAYLKEWTLILYGTSEDPNKHLDTLPSSSQRDSLHNPQLSRPPPGSGGKPPSVSGIDEHKRPSHPWLNHIPTRPPALGASSSTEVSKHVGSLHPAQRPGPLSGTRPDFEVVPAPSGAPGEKPASKLSTAPPATSNGSNTPTLSTPLKATSDLPATPPPKHPVLLLEDNKIDAPPVSSVSSLPPFITTQKMITTDPPLSVNTAQSGSQTTILANNFNSKFNNSLGPGQAPAGEDDLQQLAAATGSNQIDLKLLTKDYRSSGDQSGASSNNFRPEVSAGPAQPHSTLIVSSNDAHQNHPAQKPSSSSAAALTFPSHSQLLLTLLLSLLMRTQLLVAKETAASRYHC